MQIVGYTLVAMLADHAVDATLLADGGLPAFIVTVLSSRRREVGEAEERAAVELL
jgi:hypothetical protein